MNELDTRTTPMSTAGRAGEAVMAHLLTYGNPRAGNRPNHLDNPDISFTAEDEPALVALAGVAGIQRALGYTDLPTMNRVLRTLIARYDGDYEAANARLEHLFEIATTVIYDNWPALAAVGNELCHDSNMTEDDLKRCITLQLLLALRGHAHALAARQIVNPVIARETRGLLLVSGDERGLLPATGLFGTSDAYPLEHPAEALRDKRRAVLRRDDFRRRYDALGSAGDAALMDFQCERISEQELAAILIDRENAIDEFLRPMTAEANAALTDFAMIIAVEWWVSSHAFTVSSKLPYSDQLGRAEALAHLAIVNRDPDAVVHAFAAEQEPASILVMQHWDTITRVAKALVERGVLDPQEWAHLTGQTITEPEGPYA